MSDELFARKSIGNGKVWIFVSFITGKKKKGICNVNENFEFLLKNF